MEQQKTVAMPEWPAAVLVFVTSGAVLVLEVLGVRLLAPFVGASLDTYTAIIGTALAGISFGTWLGGKAADRFPPRSLLGPLIVFGGASVLFAIPAVQLLAPETTSSATGRVILMAFGALFVPAAVLSAVSPTVVKLQLADLRTTGSVVGRLSALATVGAIVGTFLTGFVLVGAFRISSIIVVMGASLIAAGLVIALWIAGSSRSARRSTAVAAVALTILAVPPAITLSDVCDAETRYYCIRVIEDSSSESGRFLYLDNLAHSYVDLENPEHLEFWYISVMGEVIDSVRPAGQPIDMLAVGGGAFTLPRYVEATRPGSDITVFEIDPALVEFNRDSLALGEISGLQVRTGDARTQITGVSDASQDIVVGDAFGQESVPWHLATQEFFIDVNRVLTVDGYFAMNVIDGGELNLLRAQLATAKSVFDEVALVRENPVSTRLDNFVVIAGNRPLTSPAILENNTVLTGAALDDFIGPDALVLTDDFAPADQLLAG